VCHHAISQVVARTRFWQSRHTGVNTNPNLPLVLHVEDDDGDARIVVRSLAHSPYKVRIVRLISVPEALSMIDAIGDGSFERPMMILLDLGLPRGNGVDVLKAVKEAESLRDVPVVILTGSDKDEDRAACVEAGCDDFLVKPMDYTDLVRSMNDLCGRFLAFPQPVVA